MTSRMQLTYHMTANYCCFRPFSLKFALNTHAIIFFQAYHGKILQILRFQTDLKLTLDPLRTNEVGSKVSLR